MICLDHKNNIVIVVRLNIYARACVFYLFIYLLIQYYHISGDLSVCVYAWPGVSTLAPRPIPAEVCPRSPNLYWPTLTWPDFSRVHWALSRGRPRVNFSILPTLHLPVHSKTCTHQRRFLVDQAAPSPLAFLFKFSLYLHRIRTTRFLRRALHRKRVDISNDKHEMSNIRIQ